MRWRCWPRTASTPRRPSLTDRRRQSTQVVDAARHARLPGRAEVDSVAAPGDRPRPASRWTCTTMRASATRWRPCGPAWATTLARSWCSAWCRRVSTCASAARPTGASGPVVTIGLGGVHADAIGDESSRLAPGVGGRCRQPDRLVTGRCRADGRRLRHRTARRRHRAHRPTGRRPATRSPSWTSTRPSSATAGCHVVDVRIELTAGDHLDAPLRRLI